MPQKPLLAVFLTVLDNVYFEVFLTLLLVGVRVAYLRYRKTHPLPLADVSPRDPVFEKLTAGWLIVLLALLHFNVTIIKYSGLMLIIPLGVIGYVVLQQLWEGYRKTHPLLVEQLDPTRRDLAFEAIVTGLVIAVLVMLHFQWFAVTFGAIIFILAYWGARMAWEGVRKARPLPTTTAGPLKQKDFGVEIIDTLIIAVVLVFGIVRHLLLQTYFIPSGSMEATLLGPKLPDTAIVQQTGVDYLLHGWDTGVRGGDKLFANRFIYRVRPPHRGEIVVFRPPVEAIAGTNPSLMVRAWLEAHPTDLTPLEAMLVQQVLASILRENKMNPGTLAQPVKITESKQLLYLLPEPPTPMWRDDFIKRVIAVQGDRVRVVAGEGVYVNGKLLDEPYTSAQHTASTESLPVQMEMTAPGPQPHLTDFATDTTEEALIANTDAQYAYAGHFMGWVQQWYFHEVLLKARILPHMHDGEFVVPDGAIFVMGDNRTANGSFDSRFWGVVPMQDVRARAISTFWPLDRLKLL